jgi:peptidoglycan/LPS O-acetylase OafA/YrhL
MTTLAFLELPWFRRVDRFLGDLTYPLYMSHVNVMIFALSVTTDYSFAALLIGLGLNFVVTPTARALLDPAVDRLRNTVRGRRLAPLR